jgi:hypothetical protein
MVDRKNQRKPKVTMTAKRAAVERAFGSRTAPTTTTLDRLRALERRCQNLEIRIGAMGMAAVMNVNDLEHIETRLPKPKKQRQ